MCIVFVYFIYYCWFHENGSFSVHSFNEHYLVSIYPMYSSQVAEGTVFRKHIVLICHNKMKHVQSNNNQKYRFIPIVIFSYNINNTAMKVSTAVVTSITLLFVTCSQVKQHGIIWLDGITGFPGQTAGLRINMCTVIRLALGLSRLGPV